jgi:hypothetical protein
MTDLHYDPEKHHYWVGKKRLPSVNEILTTVGIKKKYDGDPYYGEIGTGAALAIEYLLKGELDEYSIAEEIKPRIEAWKRFVKESGYKFLGCETALHNGNFAGRYDHLGIIGGETILLDTKCTEKVDDYGTDCQLSGYWVLLSEKPNKKAALRLGKDGAYDLIEYPSDPQKIWDAVWTLYQLKKNG